MDHQLTPPPRPKPQSGAALIVTLTLLLLITGLAISLFMTANTELQSASQFKNSQGLTELSDICVNLVMGQIKDATTTNAAGAPANRSTWASQPGMIRTYGSSTNAATSYKLYSWSNPRVSGDDSTSVPADWFSKAAQYTDLNAPIPNSSNSSSNFYRYPIAYPPTSGSTAPLGYTVSGAPVGAVSGEAFTNSVPMPVQWLYVLKDGTMVYPTSASGNTATISGASAANPIVARVAYWTDDETSKVNINTAAGGEYWGPLVQKNLRQLTNSYWIPARWEYQRYPGHPARTDLQAVFPDLTRKQIWAFTPRVSDNGATASNAMTTSPTSVAYDSDRLLASVGEARFSSTNYSANTNRTDFTNNWSDRLERNKFLITSSSRAPEVTLYGTPRISVWPLSTDTSTNFRTTLDSLFAFCSTIQKTTNTANPTTPGIPRPYYFVRGAMHANNQTSLNGDTNNSINTNMFTYMDSLSGVSGIPGIGTVSLATKYTTAATDGQTVAGRDQLVTQFYDYIRTINRNDNGIPGTNQFCWNSSGSGSAFVMPVKRNTSTGVTYGFGRLHTINQVAIHFICTADGADTNSANSNNLSLWTTTNSSSYVPLATNEVCIQAIAYIEPASPGVASPYLHLGDGNLFNQDYSFNVRGLNALGIGSDALGFPPLAKIYVATYPTSAGNVSSGRSGGILKYLLFLTGTYTKPPEARGGFTNVNSLNIPGNVTVTLTGRNKQTATVAGIANVPLSSTISNTNLGGSYPLVSNPIRILKGASMNLPAATINIDTVFKYYGNTFTNTTTIPFPAATIPMPTLSPNTNQWAFYPSGWNGASTNGATSGGRFPIVNTNNLSWETNLIAPNYDTVFAVATKHGDYRVSMARPGSTANWAPVPANPSFPSMQHRLFNGAFSPPAPTPTTNYWVPGANYPSNALGLLPPENASTRPAIPDKAYLDGLGIAHPLTYGDFDNGLAAMSDGPYINTPDDMASYPGGSYNGWTEFYDLSILRDVFMTPNRKISSPVAFGSLPSAARQDRPWQNLLFRPAPGVDHPGKAGFRIDGTSLTGAPPDHVWLDFFWMPIVEPWAISETFSTAGKINMNYQIAPFSYIRRTTGVQAVLRTGGVTAISSIASRYTTGRYIKSGSSGSPVIASQTIIRDQSPFPLNLDETLKGFDERLSNNAALFRTASEICELPIVPVASGATYTSMTNATGNWWADWQYTGDNTKEATYNDIYPRLTTKSNTYTVHYRLQMLKKLPGGDQSTWDESKDKVASELRGSTLIERFLDPNATYPDYATAFSTSASLETLYRFRVLQRSQFTP